MHALKGHGTENDFVIVPDLDGALELSPAAVRAICDRHAGIGADGVLRVVRSENDPESKEFAGQAEFFMDYRNADGSLAEMCGNGVRVFLRYLQRSSLVDEEAAVATRGGIVQARLRADGDISVRMGVPEVLADRPVVTAAHDEPRLALSALTIPNPHVVVAVDDVATLDALDLTVAPQVEPALPHGQNIEFVTPVDHRHLRMRVFERGVGETRSCGTGICAAAVAVAGLNGVGPDGEPWRVDVPGGTCQVTWFPDGTVELTGPAVIVAELDLEESLLAAR
ncbi:diaminopimelate epimerase [Jatrophihabitans sp.]|uniref:diaminopimelate epimerase n=1 Tax=Jatrophihabitans sp. TaxID=1932789 RepID=UPI0030C6B8D2|nr:Diaminopimelate epimerase [Jatrophihabitans sp.]